MYVDALDCLVCCWSMFVYANYERRASMFCSYQKCCIRIFEKYRVQEIFLSSLLSIYKTWCEICELSAFKAKVCSPIDFVRTYVTTSDYKK